MSAPARAAEPHCVRCGGAHPPLVMPDEDAYRAAGAVYAMPEPAQVGQVPRPFDPRTLAACAARAEQVEREALGSPIAQDVARRIRLAILTLGEERR